MLRAYCPNKYNVTYLHFEENARRDTCLLTRLTYCFNRYNAPNLSPYQSMYLILLHSKVHLNFKDLLGLICSSKLFIFCYIINFQNRFRYVKSRINCRISFSILPWRISSLNSFSFFSKIWSKSVHKRFKLMRKWNISLTWK